MSNFQKRTKRAWEELDYDQQHAKDTTVSYPAKCPVTGRPFFMIIENENGVSVPTYGGPFDSYTIPERCEEDDQDDEELAYTQERFCHDRGAWVGAETLYVPKNSHYGR